MLECQNCGAVGDAFFSENYFGEMVCELCGTQSFLQARNETQELEDMGMDFTSAVTSLKRSYRKHKQRRDADGNVIGTARHKRSKTEHAEEKPQLPALADAVIATQMVLDAMARSLVDRVGPDTFPSDEYPRVVKQLWFKFLETWAVKGTKPLLRCYNEFFLFWTREEAEKVDPAVTLDLLEEWDVNWEKQKAVEEGREVEEEVKEIKEEDPLAHEVEKMEAREAKKKEKKPSGGRKSFRASDTLSKFSIVDLLGLLMLASRVLNLGLLPSDFADWVATGVIPFHNALSTCCADEPEVRESVKYIYHFFLSVMLRHRATAVHIAYAAHHLQYQMGLRLPPLNVPLAVHRVCGAMGFPGEVFRNFQWIAGFFNAEGDVPEPPLLLQSEVNGYPRFKRKYTKADRDRVDAILESEIGIVAHLVVAIKMCANWHEWIYERQRNEEQDETKRKAPPLAAINEPHLLPRRDLDAFTKLARQVLVNPDRPGIPEDLKEHVNNLERILGTDELPTTERTDQNGRLKANDIYAYPAIHVDGVLAESDDAIEERMKRLRSQDTHSDPEEHTFNAFYYPVFYRSVSISIRSAMHPAYEHVLELLCRKIDTPIASVLGRLAELDKRMQSLVYHFERTQFHVDMLNDGNSKMKAARRASRRAKSNAATAAAPAIKAWEAKNSASAEESSVIKLYCQMPPIAKLDNSLNTLKNCEQLSLSTNGIDRLIPLSGMKKLRILSLGRNQIKKIEKLDDVSDTLEELWLSYNVIATLDGLSGLTNLTTLYVSNNLIKSWDELDKLASLPKLRDVLFTGNPIYENLSKEDARLNVLKRIPKVAKIDGDMVKQTERDAALGQ
uniref:Dynein axonemal light chain 1 n=1 Tax=Phytophthora ramorum TaxID=164328 RepID=H3GMK2_PHYRM